MLKRLFVLCILAAAPLGAQDLTEWRVPDDGFDKSIEVGWRPEAGKPAQWQYVIRNHAQEALSGSVYFTVSADSGVRVLKRAFNVPAGAELGSADQTFAGRSVLDLLVVLKTDARVTGSDQQEMLAATFFATFRRYQHAVEQGRRSLAAAGSGSVPAAIHASIDSASRKVDTYRPIYGRNGRMTADLEQQMRTALDDLQSSSYELFSAVGRADSLASSTVAAATPAKPATPDSAKVARQTREIAQRILDGRAEDSVAKRQPKKSGGGFLGALKAIGAGAAVISTIDAAAKGDTSRATASMNALTKIMGVDANGNSTAKVSANDAASEALAATAGTKIEIVTSSGDNVLFDYHPQSENVRKLLRSPYIGPWTTEPIKPPEVPDDLPCMRDKYVWAAVIHAFGAETAYRSSIRESDPATKRDRMIMAMEEGNAVAASLQQVDELRSNAPTLGSMTCATFRIWP